MRYAYAIEYAYGRTVLNHGVRADEVARFRTRAERDAWVASRRTEDCTQGGYREALDADSPAVRCSKRHMAAERGS